MTKREKLISNCIKHLQKEVCNWPQLGSQKIIHKLTNIQKLQTRIKNVSERAEFKERTLFGEQIIYPDGTKHFINNSWYED